MKWSQLQSLNRSLSEQIRHFFAVEGGQLTAGLAAFKEECGAKMATEVVLKGGERVAVEGTAKAEEKIVMKNERIVAEGEKVNGLDYLDEQLESMKNNVKINKYESAESVNDWCSASTKRYEWQIFSRNGSTGIRKYAISGVKKINPSTYGKTTKFAGGDWEIFEFRRKCYWFF
ncbi:hypothetical protein [Latilactobacillus graminis]|uniref:Uncharacterized protein n=1 Tax=Latilactobacillus graminis DSM 20719 TaxID=1423752 RepID=A0AA89I0S8_9LACO|nr:hypothetical protein [Latilactobacillus graminis]KRM22315.1 hypothetical protein FC90_GL000916 [Latilactobacillus graminis DSM 20719]